MLLIVLVHANYFSLGFIDSNDVRTNPLPSFVKIFFEQLCVVGVNVFVLISGWFGIKRDKCTVPGLFLWSACHVSGDGYRIACP